ncbi:MAG: hypothetical protein AAGI91_01935 [Bacteroidota bacterium]
MHQRTLPALLLLSLLVSGCAPSFSPLYRDYDVEPAAVASASAAVPGEKAGAQDVRDRLRAALADAGWTEGTPSAPNVVSTESRTVNHWGLWRITVSLDAVPIGDRHVRVLFHPVRRYVTGGRSKLPYLGSGLRRALLPDLNEALAAHGFLPIGTPRERDEEQVEGT